MIASRASFTQSGHSESVVRGQPKVGLLFSHDFSSGLSDHFGVNDGLGLGLLKIWTVSKITPAVLHATASSAFSTCDPTPACLGMIELPSLSFLFAKKNGISNTAPENLFSHRNYHILKCLGDTEP